MLAGASLLFVAQVIPLELALESSAEWFEFIRLTSLGQMLVARLGLGSLALLALWLAERRRFSLRAVTVACVLIGALAHATLASSSHSAAMDVGLAPVAADFAHLLAGALWGGGVVSLLVTCAHLRREAGAAMTLTAARMMSERFSPLASLGIVLAAGTGLALSSVHVPEVTSLGDSLYGQLVLLKAGLVILIVATGAMLRRTIYSRGAVQPLLFVEAMLACGVFFSAALLTSTAPPHEMIVHQMADGSLHVMTKADPDFQRFLLTFALAVFAAGAFVVALEWRNRPKEA